MKERKSKLEKDELEEALKMGNHQKFSKANMTKLTTKCKGHTKDDQEKAFKVITAHLTGHPSTKDEDNPTGQLRMLVSGAGGVGKSYLIETVELFAKEHFAKTRKLYGTVLILAATGKAALNVNGRTIHSVCPIKFLNSVKGASPCAKQSKRLQDTMGDVKLVIIDECSMTGLKMLGQIHETFQLVKSQCGSSLIMGGVHFILLGDLYQLDPVNDFQMHRSDDLNLHKFGPWAHKGIKVYKSLLCYHELFTQKRQVTVAETDVEKKSEDDFRLMLKNCRVGKSTEEDVSYCNSKVVQNLNDPLLVDCPSQNCLYVSPTNAQAARINKLALERLHLKGNKVINIWAQHILPKSLTKISMTDAQLSRFKMNCMSIPGRSLSFNREGNVHEPLLQIAIGSRVMCTKNLATDIGAVNGAIGSVAGVVYVNDPSNPAPIQPFIYDEKVATLVSPMIPIVLVQFNELSS
jgi:hypothetical protein